jgi:sRNA-binding carbon storage regulator CsrA
VSISTQCRLHQFAPDFIIFGDAGDEHSKDRSLWRKHLQPPHDLSRLSKDTLMAYSRKVLTVGALGVSAFALIGAGATATFTDGAQAHQEISADTMNMTITSTEDGAWRTTDGKTLTLKAYGPVGSTFSTGPQTIIVSNNSNTAAKMVRLAVSAPTSNAELRDSLYVKIQMANANSPVYDGLLTDLESSASPVIKGQTIAAGTSMTADVTFYAGGTKPSLPNGAQGGVVVPTFTVGFTG